MTDQNTSSKPEISAQAYKMLPWISAMALFMQMLDATVLNTALPAIAHSFGRSPLSMQSAIISYAITVALLIPLSGYLADHFGTKRVFIIAVSLFSFGSLLCTISPNLTALVVSRVIQGAGGAMMVPVARLAMIKAFDRSDLLAAINLSAVPALIGPVLGPLVGGYLVDIASWHWIFLINIPIGALGIYFGLKYLPNFQDSSEQLDFIGFCLFGFSILMVSLGLEFASEPKSGFLFAFVIALFGVFLLFSYFYHAKKTLHPLFPLSLFKIRTFTIGIIGNIGTRLGVSAIPLMVPLLVQVIFLFSPSAAGWMMVPLALATVFMKKFVTPILKKFGYRKTLISNTIFAGIGIMMLALPTQNTPMIMWVILLTIIGSINSLQFTAMNTIVLADLRPYQTSSGNSLIAANQQLSISFAIAISSAILRFLSQNQWLTHNGESLHNAFRATFIILGISTILSALIFARLHPRDGDNLLHKKRIAPPPKTETV